MTMPYRRLGRSGLKVSLLSFGSWVTFGPQLDDDLAVRCLEAAREGGVNFFDNAESYAGGQSEAIMGRAFKKLGWERYEYVVSSKFFWGIHDVPNMTHTLNRKYLMQAVDASLERFGLDFLDLIFCHRADPETPIEETVQAMSDIVTSGKALYWGTSEWAAEEIVAAIEIAERHNLHKPVMEQPQYNLLERKRVEQEYARVLSDYGIGLTTWSPLASGALTGKYLDGIPAGSRVALPGYGWLREEVEDPREQGEGSSPQGDRRRPRVSARSAGHRLGRGQSARLDGHHRSEPCRAGAGEPPLARGLGAPRRGGHEADRRGRSVGLRHQPGRQTRRPAGQDQPASACTLAMGTDVLGAVTFTASPQSLNLAEMDRAAALPLAVVVPATRIGSVSPVVATYIVSARLPELDFSDAFTATAGRPCLVEVASRVSVPGSLTSWVAAVPTASVPAMVPKLWFDAGTEIHWSAYCAESFALSPVKPSRPRTSPSK